MSFLEYLLVVIILFSLIATIVALIIVGKRKGWFVNFFNNASSPPSSPSPPSPPPPPPSPPEVFFASVSTKYPIYITMDDINNKVLPELKQTDPNVRLATYKELSDSYDKGAQWCSSGFVLDKPDCYYPMQEIKVGCGGKGIQTYTPKNSNNEKTCGGVFYGIKPIKTSANIFVAPFNK